MVIQFLGQGWLRRINEKEGSLMISIWYFLQSNPMFCQPETGEQSDRLGAPSLETRRRHDSLKQCWKCSSTYLFSRQGEKFAFIYFRSNFVSYIYWNNCSLKTHASLATFAWIALQKSNNNNYLPNLKVSASSVVKLHTLLKSISIISLSAARWNCGPTTSVHVTLSVNDPSSICCNFRHKLITGYCQRSVIG